jgi:ABC-type branched-subunit amino acid transport system permease subunit
MLASSVSGAALNVANTELLVVALSSIFIAMSGVCVSMVNSIVIDNIPTHLR